MALIDSASTTDPLTGLVYADYKLDLGTSGRWDTSKQLKRLADYEIYDTRRVKVKGKKTVQVLIDYDAPNLTSFDAYKDRLFFPEGSLNEIYAKPGLLGNGTTFYTGIYNANILCIIPTQYSIFESQLQTGIIQSY